MGFFDDSKFSVKFYLYEYAHGGKESYPVYARILYKRKKSDISMRMMAGPKDWDFENQMFYPTKAFNRYNNNKLLTARDSITQLYNKLKYEKKHFTVKTLRGIFKGEVTEYSGMKFIDYYDMYVAECKKRTNEYGEGVLEHYRKCRRHLWNYMVANKIEDVLLGELSRNFIVGFENYLLSTPIVGKDYPMNRNTSCTYLRKLVAVINRSVAKELIDKSPFHGFRMARIKNTRITYLNADELDAVKKHDLGGNKSLMRIRDIFLFSVYTGLRYSDAINLTTEEIKKDRTDMMWIRICQKKTKENLEFPMLAEAVCIYEKYELDRNKTGFILPRICNQKVNTSLKIIANLAGIDKCLTHHVGRHTFATTICLENGVDLKTTSKLLGHHSVKSTEIYAQVTNRRLTDVVSMLNGKI